MPTTDRSERVTTVTPVNLRKLGPPDAAALLRLFGELDPAFFRPHPFTPEEAARVAGCTGRNLHAVAIRDGKFIGYGMLRGWDEGFDTPSLGICLRADAQGEGVGRAFMHWLHGFAAGRGATHVRLRVHADNVRARRLYEAMGYREAGEERGELVMIATL